jgi:hypothetical protein
MSTSIDLSRTTGLVALGTHSFQVTDRTSEEMGGSGYNYWRLICKVISAGDDQGKEIMHQISLAPQSRFVMDEFLDGIGAPKRGKWSLEKCIGKKFRASVIVDEYEGKPKSAFESILPASELQQSFDDLPSETEQPDEALPDDVVSGGESDEEEEGTDKESGRRQF